MVLSSEPEVVYMLLFCLKTHKHAWAIFHPLLNNNCGNIINKPEHLII